MISFSTIKMILYTIILLYFLKIVLQKYKVDITLDLVFIIVGLFLQSITVGSTNSISTKMFKSQFYRFRTHFCILIILSTYKCK